MAANNNSPTINHVDDANTALVQSAGLEPIDPRALYSRRDASPYLGGISVATMIRMERAGTLKPVKPSRLRLGTTYYEGSNLIAVRRGMDQ
jgi:hypothetical protein